MNCQWRADQLFAEAELRQIIDLQGTDNSRCFAINDSNNCFIIRLPSLFTYFDHFLAAQGGDRYFSLENLVPITHEKTNFCRSPGGLSANGKEEKKCIE